MYSALAAIGDLNQDQLALRTSPAEMSIWQIASHMAGGRAYWFHDVLGEQCEQRAQP